jgi:hypothetical protein
VPPPLAARGLKALELLLGEETPLTWDEAELLRAECVSSRGSADAEALGCRPERMGLVLGLG